MNYRWKGRKQKKRCRLSCGHAQVGRCSRWRSVAGGCRGNRCTENEDEQQRKRRNSRCDPGKIPSGHGSSSRRLVWSAPGTYTDSWQRGRHRVAAAVAHTVEVSCRQTELVLSNHTIQGAALDL